VGADLAVAVGFAVVPVGAEVGEPGFRAGEQVPDDDQDGAADGAFGPVAAQALAEAAEPFAEEGAGARGTSLDGDLERRDDARHGGRATPRLTAWHGAGCRVTAGHHRPGGSGGGRPASAAAPGSVRTREGAASADTPGRGQSPAFSHRRHRPGGGAHFSSRLRSRPPRARLRWSRAASRRWRPGGRRDPSLVRYVQPVARHRLPGTWPLDPSLSVGLIPMLLWSTLVVNLGHAVGTGPSGCRRSWPFVFNVPYSLTSSFSVGVSLFISFDLASPYRVILASIRPCILVATSTSSNPRNSASRAICGSI
jgi:hypothetical protein